MVSTLEKELDHIVEKGHEVAFLETKSTIAEIEEAKKLQKGGSKNRSEESE